MLIVCPHCASSYEVQPGKLGPSGRSVRCARCATTWLAVAPSLAVAPRATAAAGTAAFSESIAPPSEQIEGGEFGWTFIPEKDRTGDDFDPPAVANRSAEDAEAERAVPVADDPQARDPREHDPRDAGAVAVVDAPALVPVLEGDGSAANGIEPHAIAENVESLAARRAQRSAARKLPRRRPGLPLLVAAMALALGGLVAGRKHVVRWAPQTASLYEAIGLPVNLRGLVFEGVKTGRETSDGVAVLVVEGKIVNVTARTIEVPRLRYGVRNPAGLEVYAWTSLPARTVLPPGEMVEFRSRLASPPAEARDVMVRFFNRRDIVAATQ